MTTKLIKEASSDKCECCGGPVDQSSNVHSIADMDERVEFRICKYCMLSSPREAMSSVVINTIRDLMEK